VLYSHRCPARGAAGRGGVGCPFHRLAASSPTGFDLRGCPDGVDCRRRGGSRDGWHVCGRRSVCGRRRSGQFLSSNRWRSARAWVAACRCASVRRSCCTANVSPSVMAWYSRLGRSSSRASVLVIPPDVLERFLRAGGGEVGKSPPNICAVQDGFRGGGERVGTPPRVPASWIPFGTWGHGLPSPRSKQGILCRRGDRRRVRSPAGWSSRTPEAGPSCSLPRPAGAFG
jgi:hypothetical protein